MNFGRYLTAPRIVEFNLIPLIDLGFLLVFFVILSTFFNASPAMRVQLPKAVTSDAFSDNNIIIITSENILYYNNKVVTLDELKDVLAKPQNRRRPVLIKSDRRASFGRIVDVWNLGRSLGIERINVASDQEQ